MYVDYIMSTFLWLMMMLTGVGNKANPQVVVNPSFVVVVLSMVGFFNKFEYILSFVVHFRLVLVIILYNIVFGMLYHKSIRNDSLLC